MQFSVGTITRCGGNSSNHYHVPLTISGQTQTITFNISEFIGRPFSTHEEAKELIAARLRSALREANANTFVQARLALETKTFEV